MRKKITIGWLIVIGCWANGWAIDEHFKALLKELEDYTQAHIVPVMKIQRERLNDYLMDEDLKYLAELGKQYEEMRAKKNKLLNKKSATNPDKIAQEWEQIQQTKKNIQEEISILSEKYEQIIQRLLDEIEFQKTIWRAEMNKIVDKYNAKIDDMRLRHFKKHNFGEWMQVEGFLLWNIKQNYTENREAGADEGALGIFPNPASHWHTISFDLIKAGEVKIVLLDIQGKPLRNVIQKYFPIGKHQISTYIGDIVKSLYFYRIITPNGIETKKWLKEE